MSRASQRRLRVLLASVNRERVGVLPLFATLTYPGEWSPDPRRWKRDLDAVSKRLMRQYPSAMAVWVIEFQARGAPHFHLIVYGVPRIEKDWLSRAWYEVVDSGDERHLRAGTQVERARSWRAVQGYISKYVSKMKSKELAVPDGIGRWWGVINRERLREFVQWVEKRVSLREFFALRRVLRRYLRSKGVSFVTWSPLSGVLVFMPAECVVRLL